jgi:hypothetical protein
MSPALIALLAPLLHGLLSLLGGTAIENWLLDHSLTWVAGFIARNWKLSGEWTLSGGVSNAAEGIVTVSIYRSGRTVGVFTVYALALTAAHQTTIAAVVGALFHQGEEQIIGWFKSAASSAAAARQPVAVAQPVAGPVQPVAFPTVASVDGSARK